MELGSVRTCVQLQIKVSLHGRLRIIPGRVPADNIVLQQRRGTIASRCIRNGRVPADNIVLQQSASFVIEFRPSEHKLV